MVLMERFNQKYEAEPMSGCWLWICTLDGKGYGKLKVAGKLISGHRLSWELHRGEIPIGKWVLHRCDNRMCVNPEHLFLGTARDNVLDMVQKGRWGKLPGQRGGEKNYNARLTWEKVRDIRTRRIGMGAFARFYGISHRMVGKIQRNENWIEISPEKSISRSHERHDAR